MHRQHVLLRQQEVLHREHRLLHLAGVAHAGDQHLALGEVEDHAAIGVGAVTLGHALEVGDVEHLPLGLAGRVVGFRVDEQLAAEQVLPGGLGGHLHRQVVFGGRAYMDVGNEVVLGVVERLDTGPQGIELVCRELAVDRTPADGLGGTRLVDDEAVGRRATGAVAGADHQRAVGRQLAFAAAKGLFDQLGGTDIGVHGGVGLRHESPHRLRAGLPNKYVVEASALLQREKSARDYARKAVPGAATDPAGGRSSPFIRQRAGIVPPSWANGWQ
ncbi:hypothetical protein D9M69_271470 [compost metagenome]